VRGRVGVAERDDERSGFELISKHEMWRFDDLHVVRMKIKGWGQKVTSRPIGPSMRI
jgi:hypothetical protein